MTGTATMRAARYHGPGDIRIEEIARPAPADDEILVRVHANGICGTDASEFVAGPQMYPIHTRHGLTGHCGPLVPGHEFCGTVEQIGAAVHGFREGEGVVTGAVLWCGECRQCKAGRTSICALYAAVGLHRDGGLAEFVRVPAHVLVRIDPLGLDPDIAVLTQPMAIAVHALRRSGARAGEDAVVIGVGGIGAFLVYALAQAGLQVVAVDILPERLAIAQHLGAQHAFGAREPAALREALVAEGLVPSLVFEVTGGNAGMAAASATVEPGGRIVAVGIAAHPIALDMRRITTKEVELIGTNALIGKTDVPEAARLLSLEQHLWNELAPVAIPLERLVEDGIVPIVEGRAPYIKMLVDPSTTVQRPTRAAPAPAVRLREATV